MILMDTWLDILERQQKKKAEELKAYIERKAYFERLGYKPKEKAKEYIEDSYSSEDYI